MAADATSWQIGPVYFPPVALVLPILAALIVLGLGKVCTRYRVASVITFLVPIAIGVVCAVDGLTAPSSYAADYAFLAAWAFSVITASGSVPLLPLRVSRRAGVLGIIAAILILVSFYATFFAGYSLGMYDWWGDQLVPIFPVDPR
ncbi:MAG: hypothetical protein WD733_01340 [Bryobacterales bacterium]